MAEPNGTLTRITAVSGIIRDVGFPVAMVAIFVGWTSGWIPLRPLDAFKSDLQDHDARMVAAQERRIEIDKSIAESIKKFTLLAERMERRERLTYCLTTYKDAELRRECLQ